MGSIWRSIKEIIDTLIPYTCCDINQCDIVQFDTNLGDIIQCDIIQSDIVNCYIIQWHPTQCDTNHCDIIQCDINQINFCIPVILIKWYVDTVHSMFDIIQTSLGYYSYISMILFCRMLDTLHVKIMNYITIFRHCETIQV